MALLDDPSYKRMATDSGKENYVIERSSVLENVAEQPWTHGLRPSRLYTLPKINKAGDPLTSIVNTIKLPTNRLVKHQVVC
jgi:hypothetical protein